MGKSEGMGVGSMLAVRSGTIRRIPWPAEKVARPRQPPGRLLEYLPFRCDVRGTRSIFDSIAIRPAGSQTAPIRRAQSQFSQVRIREQERIARPTALSQRCDDGRFDRCAAGADRFGENGTFSFFGRGDLAGIGPGGWSDYAGDTVRPSGYRLSSADPTSPGDWGGLSAGWQPEPRTHGGR